MKKSLAEWKEEIDAGIARGKADIKSGRYKKLDASFMKNMQDRVIQRIRKRKELAVKNEKVWVMM